jgi:hypothetical protein
MLIGSTPGGATAVLSNLELQPGQRLEKTIDLTPTLLSVLGRVTQEGQPVAADVKLFRGTSGDNQPQDSAVSDPSSGAFQFLAIPAGSTYLIVAETKDGARAVVEVPLQNKKQPAPLELMLTRTVSVRLELPPEIERRLASGASLQLLSPKGTSLPVAAGEGGSPMATIPPGNYGVMVGDEQVGTIEVLGSGGTAKLIPTRP